MKGRVKCESSRERILAALGHIQPDQVPVDFGCHASSGIMAIAYNELRRYLDLPKRLPRVFDLIQQLAVPDDDVLERFGVDIIDFGRGFCQDNKWWKEWRLPDGTDCLVPSWADIRQKDGHWYLYSPSGRAIAVQKKGSLYFEQIYFPLADDIPDDLSDLPRLFQDVMWSLPKPPGPSVSNSNELVEGAIALRESSDRAIAVSLGGSMMGSGQILCCMDRWLMRLAAEPEKAHKLLDKVLEMHLERLDSFLKAVGSCIDIIVFADDLGMQTGPLISQAMYREFFKPRHEILWNRAKELARIKVLLHCCGSIYPFIGDFIDAGLDALNPVQTSCANMEPVRLKKEFGEKLCFFGGGCDTQIILPNAMPEEIRQHVLERLEIFSPGGGFVFNQIHNVMANVPPENVVATYDAVAEFNGRSI